MKRRDFLKSTVGTLVMPLGPALWNQHKLSAIFHTMTPGKKYIIHNPEECLACQQEELARIAKINGPYEIVPDTLRINGHPKEYYEETAKGFDMTTVIVHKDFKIGTKNHG